MRAARDLRIGLPQQRAEMAGDRAHAGGVRAGAAILGLGVRIVIRVGVDVVKINTTAFVDDELDAGNADAVRRKEALPALDQRVLEVADDLEQDQKRDRW